MNPSRTTWRAGAARLGTMLLGALTIAAGMVVAPAVAPTASALTGSQFNPGLIISDQIFFNSTSMDAAGIQAFLNSKVAACTAGYTCLKDYRQTTTSIAADPMCTAITGKADQTAAQIIADVAVACGISPQVILVTLQKEQGLVTSTKPISNAYRSAMGAGCPDSSVCDSNYYGFFNQVHYGAYLMKRYTQPAGTGPGTSYYTDFAAAYRVGSTVAIKYSKVCAGPAVTIQNMATHVLYVYTPYQPEPAVLANLTGSVPGDACAAYGNRNFWVYFNTWFGSSVIPPGTQAFVTAAYSDVLGRTPSASELNFWVTSLLNGSSRTAVAGGFNNSDEYRRMKIDAAYQNVLGRAADASGELWWLNAMRAGALQPDDAQRTFYTYPEFYANSGGTDAAYIDALYLAIVGRASDTSGAAHWLSVYEDQGALAVVNGMWYAPETYSLRVSEAYQSLLGRGPSETDTTFWMAYAQKNGLTSMRSAIMASQEYYNRATTRFPDAGTTT